MKIYFKIIILSSTLFLVGCVADSPSPTDESLINTFTENKEIFTTLRAKVCEDGYSVISISPEWSKPNEIPPAVKKKYYELMNKINVIQLRRRDDDTVVFTVWNIGNVSGGDSKGYIYGPDSNWPRQEMKSLDKFSSFKEEFFCKREIDDNWFLYYDHSL